MTVRKQLITTDDVQSTVGTSTLPPSSTAVKNELDLKLDENYLPTEAGKVLMVGTDGKVAPTTFTGGEQSDWTETDTSKVSYIQNKPFKTVGTNLSVDTDGKLNADVTLTQTAEDIKLNTTSLNKASDTQCGIMTKEDHADMQKKSNLTNDWSTASSTNYPSTEIVKAKIAECEEHANKVSAWQTTPDNTHYPSEKLVKDNLDTKQETLVSGTNIKTVNSNSLLGNGDVTLELDRATWGKIDGDMSSQYDLTVGLSGKQGVLVSGTNIKTVNGISILGEGNVDIGTSKWGSIGGTLANQTDLVAELAGKQATLVSGTTIKTINDQTLLGEGNLNLGAIWGTITGSIDNQNDLANRLATKQALLVSGTNIKTINGQSIVGSGNISISTDTHASTHAADGSDPVTIYPGQIDGTLSADQIPNISAEKITSGTLMTDVIPDINVTKLTGGYIDVSHIPPSSFENLVKVADDEARFALTEETVHKGYSVYVIATQKLYIVVDVTKLSTEEGYVVYTSSTDWVMINNKPSFYPSSWGGIGGIIGNQTDLGEELDKRIPVQLGSTNKNKFLMVGEDGNYELRASQIVPYVEEETLVFPDLGHSHVEDTTLVIE